jgi:hypothetical protein
VQAVEPGESQLARRLLALDALLQQLQLGLQRARADRLALLRGRERESKRMVHALMASVSRRASSTPLPSEVPCASTAASIERNVASSSASVPTQRRSRPPTTAALTSQARLLPPRVVHVPPLQQGPVALDGRLQPVGQVARDLVEAHVQTPQPRLPFEFTWGGGGLGVGGQALAPALQCVEHAVHGGVREPVLVQEQVLAAGVARRCCGCYLQARVGPDQPRQRRRGGVWEGVGGGGWGVTASRHLSRGCWTG